MSADEFSTLFLDLGGVVLTNGWDHAARRRAAETFGLDAEEMQARHNLCFDLYEMGRITLDDYLEQTIFYERRPFGAQAFRDFMFAQSQPHPEMLDLLRALRQRYRLRVAAVSNEGRELAEYRIAAFVLAPLFDLFVVSAFVQTRKPDPAIYRLALDLTQAEPSKTIYVEDRQALVEAGARLGLRGIRHTRVEETRAALAECGLRL